MSRHRRRRTPDGEEPLETKAGTGLETKRAAIDFDDDAFSVLQDPVDSESVVVEPRWRRRAEARPDEILDAALAEFTELSFDAARVEDVARRAGISKAGLYLYFDSKEELLRALIEREVAPLAQAIKSLAESGLDDPAETFGGIIAGLTTVLSDPRVFAVPRIVLSVAGRFPEIAAYYRENVVEPALGAFAQLLEAGVESGSFRRLDPMVVGRAAMGPLLVGALWTHVLGGEEDAHDHDARVREHLDLLMNGLAEGEGKP